jgi:hypothetical protein
MALLSRKEFAAMCHGSTNTLNVHVSRGKVALYPGNTKLIDPENPLNAKYLSEYQSPAQAVPKVSSRPSLPPVVDKKKLEKLKKEAIQPETREIKQKVARQMAVDQRRVDKDNHMQELDIKSKELKNQQLEMQLQKAAGQLLPIDLAQGVIERHANTIFVEFDKGIERIAKIFMAKTGCDPGMQAELMQDAKVELESAIKLAGLKSNEEVEILVGDYSETLTRGQRKV